MPGLTDEDMERIEQFARRKAYRRSPDLLCPDEETDGEEGPDVQ